jgi:hypothetical protein
MNILNDNIAKFSSIGINPFLNIVRATIFIYTLLFAYYGAYIPASCLCLGLFFLDPLTRYMIAKKRGCCAAMLLIASCNFYILVSSLLFSQPLDCEYYFLPTLILSFILFKPTEKKEIVSSIFITLLFTLLYLYFPKLPDEIIFSENFPYAAIKKLNFFGALYLTGFFLIKFIDTHATSFADKINAEKTSRKKLELIIEGAQVGCWDWDLSNNTVYFDGN